jgi:hypothetical protein
MPVSSFGTFYITIFISSSHMLSIPASLVPESNTALDRRQLFHNKLTLVYKGIFRGASYKAVTSNACPLKLLLAVQQVHSLTKQ